MNFDIAIIGGGPGGYNAAEKATKLGMQVVLFEKEDLGGTCLNRGCMPTKALIHSTELYESLAHAADLGINVENYTFDFAAMHARKAQVVEELRKGVEKLMKAGKITVVYGQAQIAGSGVVTCEGETYEVKDIIIATGSKVAYPPIPGIHDEGVYNSRDILEGDGIMFKSLIIIGGGVVGIECASIYNSLGCEVTVLEAADHILPVMDKEIATRLGMMMKKRGIKVEAKAMVQKIEGTPGNMTVTYLDKKGKEVVVSAEGVLAAAGRCANIDGLFAEGVEIEMFKNAIVGDEVGRTSIPNVYVIGDAKAKNIQLAHVAEAQGANAVAVIAGKEPPIDMSVVPSCVYTNPEIAAVGMNEDQAKAAGFTPKAVKFLTGANGKCLIENTDSGYVKLITDAADGRILGAHLVCPRATDMIGELALAVQKGITAEGLHAVIHPHPTFTEMISGAAALVEH
ncbi:MAG: dihydrolipoyl dehydrogenase [Ruminiclostridium sp.]|nr:dihydrolipoyl dehydrogenase [Ruminiclostridium sp.]